MRKKLPSSASLQAFEAAARHGNFARAAEELSLTEGAISRQIARLESLLNCKLFERTGSRVRLNPNGARYAHHVRETLERLERDAQYLMGVADGSRSLEIAFPDLCQPLVDSPSGGFSSPLPGHHAEHRGQNRAVYSYRQWF